MVPSLRASAKLTISEQYDEHYDVIVPFGCDAVVVTGSGDG
jgi:hypothetical protein